IRAWMYSRNGSSLEPRAGRSLAFGACSLRKYLRTVFLDNPSSALIARMLSPWRLNTWISTYPSSLNMPGPSERSGPRVYPRGGSNLNRQPGSLYNRHRQQDFDARLMARLRAESQTDAAERAQSYGATGLNFQYFPAATSTLERPKRCE